MVELIKHEASLEIVVDDMEAVRDARDIYEVLEWHLCNGWEIIRPEEVGALTDGMLLTDDFLRNDQGTLLEIGDIFWDSNYQVSDALEALRTEGKVTFVKG